MFEDMNRKQYSRFQLQSPVTNPKSPKINLPNIYKFMFLNLHSKIILRIINFKYKSDSGKRSRVHDL